MSCGAKAWRSGKSMDPAAYESLTEVASRAPKDPLASESQSALEIEM